MNQDNLFSDFQKKKNSKKSINSIQEKFGPLIVCNGLIKNQIQALDVLL